MPHSKAYLRWSHGDHGPEIAWCYVGSHNLSKAGAMPPGGVAAGEGQPGPVALPGLLMACQYAPEMLAASPPRSVGLP